MRAAEGGEPLDLVDVGDRHEAGEDRHVDPRGARAPDELEVTAVVEEELRDEEVRARFDLQLAVAQVLRQVPRLGMTLRIAGASDAEIDAARVRHLPRELHQVVRVGEPFGMDDELALAPRGIAAQGEHVGDAGIADHRELLLQLLARGAHAGEVRHRLDLGLALDARDHLQRPAP